MAENTDPTPAPSGATLAQLQGAQEHRPAAVVVHACSRALATSTEQRAGDAPTAAQREAVLESFRAALYSAPADGGPTS
jgi:hypothetical protein